MIMISGPSTVGKNPLIYAICKTYGFKYITPCTTRKIRKEETNGFDYIFLTKQEFQNEISKSTIKEWDYCLNNYYGYFFSFPGEMRQITHGLSRMVLRIKNKHPDDITTVFLMPRNIDKINSTIELIYEGEMLALRKALVEEELFHSKMFDYILPCSESSLELLDTAELKHILMKEDIDNRDSGRRSFA